MSESLINKVLKRGVSEVIIKNHLEEALSSGRKLRVKFGIDPTAPDLHLGHTVVLRKLRQFQDLGHQAVLIIGDFTALVGDPSGRNSERPPLSEKEVKENLKHYLEQAGKILEIEKTEIHYNSEWFKGQPLEFLMSLMSKFTVARILERDDFQKRLQNDQDISLQEIIYPLLQGYDSVAVKADVELGGNDQTFNLLTGRKMQRRFDQEEQDVLTVPLLEGLDGVKKMSKSVGNYIAVSEDPNGMFAKLMSVPDELVPRYAELLTDIENKEIERMKEELHPKEFKVAVARDITAFYHGEKLAEESVLEFDRVFKEKAIPTDIPVFSLENKKYSAVELLSQTEMVSSKSEARRVIEQGGFSVNDEVVSDSEQEIDLKSGDVLKKGKRHFLKIV